MNQASLIEPAITTKDLNVSISGQAILSNINVSFPQRNISTIVGPSGGGKSSLLRCFNQIGRLTDKYEETGDLFFFGKGLSQAYPSLELLRQNVGMVFQSPCIYPTTIRKNIMFGVEKLVHFTKQESDAHLEQVLKSASLWDEVSHRLDEPANSLSLGQKQRLCIARVLIMKPEIILLDEPTASLDLNSVRLIEKLLLKLKQSCSIILVTHDIGQVRRVADYIVMIENGKILNQGSSQDIFSDMHYAESTGLSFD